MERIYRYVLAGFFWIVCHAAMAQHTENSLVKTDVLTYRLLTEQKWDSLIYVAEKAMGQGMDFYYLRLRLGMAYYEKGLFMKAIPLLEYSFDRYPENMLVAEYLYFAYRFAGRELQAAALSHKMDSTTQRKLHTKRLVNKIVLEGGYNYSDNVERNSSLDIVGRDSIYAEHELSDYYQYGQFGIQHRLWGGIQMYHGFTKLNIRKIKIIEAKETYVKKGLSEPYTLSSMPFIEFRDTVYGSDFLNNTDEFFTEQYEYYGRMDIPLGNKMVLSPAFHFVRDRYTTNYAHFDTSMIYLQSYDIAAGNPKKMKSSYGFYTKDTAVYSRIFALELTYFMKRATLAPSVIYNDINKQKQLEYHLSFTFFPKYNLHFYTTTEAKFISQKSRKRWIVKQLIGKRLSDQLWGEGYFTFGDISNSTDKNALIVYNNPDKTKFKTGINLICLVNTQIELSLRYNYVKRRSSFIQYRLDSDDISYKTINYAPYNNHYFIGGIVWRLN